MARRYEFMFEWQEQYLTQFFSGCRYPDGTLSFVINYVYVANTDQTYINNSGAKIYSVFVRGHYLFRETNSFPRAKLEENCELRGTGNVQGQISEHIFVPNGDYCLYYPSNLFRNARSFENWGIFSDIPQF